MIIITMVFNDTFQHKEISAYHVYEYLDTFYDKCRFNVFVYKYGLKQTVSRTNQPVKNIRDVISVSKTGTIYGTFDIYAKATHEIDYRHQYDDHIINIEQYLLNQCSERLCFNKLTLLNNIVVFWKTSH